MTIQGPLWYRGLAHAAWRCRATARPLRGGRRRPRFSRPVEDQLDALLSAYGAKRIVIGHTPILSGIAVLYGGR